MYILATHKGYVVMREEVISFTGNKQLATRIPTRIESDRMERILFEENIEAVQQKVPQ